MALFKQQFLLTKHNVVLPDFQDHNLGDYTLYYHQDLEFECYCQNELELYLLGCLYDYKHPQRSNLDILKQIANGHDTADLISRMDQYCGHFVMIIKTRSAILLFNDATGQSEVFYTTKFCTFATQPKLIARVTDLQVDDDIDCQQFYDSDAFKEQKVYIAGHTIYKNVKHLKPNHYLNLELKEMIRFFPLSKITEIDIDQAATKASEMIRGFLKAITFREPAAIAVTAGYDSRMLFLASLGTRSQYYITKYGYLDENHYDLRIPKLLTEKYGKSFHVIHPPLSDNLDQDYLKSVDFPNYISFENEVSRFKGHVFISGVVCETAKNYFGYHKNLSPRELSFLSVNSTLTYPSKQYENWLRNKNYFNDLGYFYLDIFHWEERVGTLVAKGKTETYALGVKIISPFNCRQLLQTVLSVKRENRDSHEHQLFIKIITLLSSEAMAIPVNPRFRKQVVILMKRLKIYNLYRYLWLKWKVFRSRK